MYIIITYSICAVGNYPLCRVLPQIYDDTKDQIHDHAMALVSLLPSCDLTEKLALLHLFALISNNMPTVCIYSFRNTYFVFQNLLVSLLLSVIGSKFASVV